MRHNCKRSFASGNLRWALILVAVFVATDLLWGGIAQAVNNRPPSFNEDEKLQAALTKIQKEKAKAQAAQTAAMAKEITPLEREWGIKLYGIRWTAAGYILHMKFRVLDPVKAYPLLKRKIDRHVIVEKSGAVLKVPFSPKVGSLRGAVRTPNMVKKDRNYEALFANPGRHVKRGDKVTLVIGNFMAEHLTVQ